MTSEANAEKTRVAAGSVAVATFLTGTKLIVGLATGSLGILSEAAHSGLDLVAAAMTWWAVTVSGRPADAEHPYGFQKIENLSALFETLLLLVTCIWILYEAVERLFFKAVPIEVNAWSFGVILVSIVLDFTRSRMLYRVAKKTHSQALEADALHFSSDIASSAVVLVGLLFAKLGFPMADPIAAMSVAILVCVICFRLGWSAIEKLSDKVPSDHVERAAAAAMGVPGVLGVWDVRVREAGDRHFVDLKISVSHSAAFGEAHAVTDAVEKALQTVFRGADVVVHAEPAPRAGEGLWDRAHALAGESGGRVHDLTLLGTPGGLEMDLHLEWPPETPFAEAHRRATLLEEALQEADERLTAVNIHLEPAEERPASGREVTAAHPALVATIRAAAAGIRPVLACTGVRLREWDGRWAVAVTVTLPPDLALPEVHEATGRVEERVLALDPRLARVVVHAEPAESP